jgi:hypothetical protein
MEEPIYAAVEVFLKEPGDLGRRNGRWPAIWSAISSAAAAAAAAAADRWPQAASTPTPGIPDIAALVTAGLGRSRPARFRSRPVW